MFSPLSSSSLLLSSSSSVTILHHPFPNHCYSSPAMAPPSPITLTFYSLLACVLFASFLGPGNAAEDAVLNLHPLDKNLPSALHSLNPRGEGRSWKSGRRLMIGSTAPTCTYNECRGCKFRCRAEQIPVDANDPINSAYHYRCVCHR